MKIFYLNNVLNLRVELGVIKKNTFLKNLRKEEKWEENTLKKFPINTYWLCREEKSLISSLDVWETKSNNRPKRWE